VASLDDCRHGRVDLVVGPDLAYLPRSANPRGSAPVDFDDFVARPLYTRRFVVVSAAADPRESLSLDDFCAAPHALYGIDGSGRGFVDDLLASLGRTRRVAATVTSFYSVAALVARSELLATLPAEVAASSPFPLRVWEAPFALPSLPMMMAWHPHRTAEARHRFVREAVIAAVRRRVGPP
jgi:DNA-binding transcriptional LysR family regulator